MSRARRPDAPPSVTVLLFAAFRDAVGRSEVTMALVPEDGPTSVGDLWRALVVAHPGLAKLPPAAAVNARLVRFDDVLAPGDEVAFLPPVSGG